MGDGGEIWMMNGDEISCGIIRYTYMYIRIFDE
jgi:hypothetical protein